MKEKCICGLCGSSNTSVFMPELNYYECKNCLSVFVYPLLEQDDYIENFDYLTNPEQYLEIVNPEGTMWIIDKFEEVYSKKVKRPKGNLLEIGSGLGHLLILALAKGWNPEGIETSFNATQWARKNLKMNVNNTTIEKFETIKKFDAFIMIEVIEHFLNAKESLKKLARLSKSPALIFGTTPNVKSKSWENRKDLFNPKDHIFLFSEKSLEILLSELNMEDISFQYFGGNTGDAHIIFSCRINNEIVKTELINHSAAGEILENTIIEQNLEFPYSIKGADITLEILFATYNRVNNGSIKIQLLQGDNIAETVLDVYELKDNAFKEILFKNVTITKGNAKIRIIGVDGIPNNAITTWLTTDVPLGGVIINGSKKEKGLVFKIRRAH